MKIRNYVVWGLGIIQLIASVILGSMLVKMLPTAYVAAYVIAELILAGLTFISVKKLWSSICMGTLSVIVTIIMCIAIFALGQVQNTIDKVTDTPQETTVEMSIIVLTDSDVKEIKDISELQIGYMAEGISTGAQEVMKKINEEIGGEASYREYPTVVDLMEGLYEGEVCVAIIDTTYLEMLAEAEEYADIHDKVKIIATYEVVDYFEIITEDTQTENDTQKEDGQPSQNPGGQTSVPSKPKTDKDHFVVYISGIDTYGSVTAKSRSDVNILAVVNVKTKHVQLINTPRDYYVPLPNSNGVKDKLTHAGNYGINCSMGTLEMLYNIKIDYYMRVNFTGFMEIIDALGGVDVYSEFAFKNFKQGMNHLNGKQALEFARTRKAFATGDNQRGKNQMAVVTAVIQKMASPELLNNYSEILEAIGDAFQTNMSSDEIYRLVKGELENPGAWKVESYAVTGGAGHSTTFSLPYLSTYVMIPYQDNIATAKEKIRTVLEEQ